MQVTNKDRVVRFIISATFFCLDLATDCVVNIIRHICKMENIDFYKKTKEWFEALITHKILFNKNSIANNNNSN